MVDERERIIRIHIERLPEGVYLATSEDVQGLVAQGRTVAETLEIARREALTGVRKTYWNLLYVRKSREITAETLELFRRLESVAGTRYRSGNTSYQDVIKVTIKHANTTRIYQK